MKTANWPECIGGCGKKVDPSKGHLSFSNGVCHYWCHPTFKNHPEVKRMKKEYEKKEEGK